MVTSTISRDVTHVLRTMKVTYLRLTDVFQIFFFSDLPKEKTNIVIIGALGNQISMEIDYCLAPVTLA